jgi:hypothetical protein
MWRLLLMSIWLPSYFLLLWLPLYILGWILIPLAAACEAYYQDPATQLWHFTWSIMGIYDNASDGIACNDYWPTITNMYSRIWRWSANRNPLASITKIPLVHCAINPLKVQFDGSLISSNGNVVFTSAQEVLIQQYNQKVPCWYVAWDGLFSCWYWQFNWSGLILFGKQLFAPGLYLIWIGAKIKPTDIFGVEAYRTPRTYNTIQFNQQA